MCGVCGGGAVGGDASIYTGAGEVEKGGLPAAPVGT